jgi:hypothetical protein
MLHPLSSEIVEFPFRIPSQIGIVDDGLDDIAWVVRSFSGESGRLEVTGRGDEGSDLHTYSESRAFGSALSRERKMAAGWTGGEGLTAKFSGMVDLTLPFMNLLGSNESRRCMAW